MRLRLNTTLRAALIAAITAVGFTLTQAQATDLNAIITMSDMVNSATVVGQGAKASTVWEIQATDTMSANVVYDFDGSSYLTGITNSNLISTLNGSSYVTIAAWINPTSHAGGAGSVEKGDGGAIFGYGAQNDGIKLIDNNGAAKATTKGKADFNNAKASGIDTASDTWQLVAITFHANGSNTEVKTMVGSNISSMQSATGMQTPAQTDQVFAIGSSNYNKARELFQGSIAALTVFTSDDWVTTQEVAGAMYAAPTKIVYPTQTWAGTLQQHDWSDAVWVSGGGDPAVFDPKNDAEFTGTGHNEVSITTAASASNVTVGGQDYTFNLSAGASLTTGTLTVNNDATLALTGEGTVTATEIAASGKTINIGEDVTLQGVSSGAGTLAGAGTYVLKNGTTSMGTIVLGDNWAGIVRISGAYTNMQNTINALDGTNAGSRVELKGVSGWFGGDVDANIVLTGTGEGGTGTALNVNNGSSGATRVFSGTVSGKGNLEHSWNTAGAQTYKFSGDVSGWTGTFKDTNGTGSIDVIFSGNAKEINADIYHDRNCTTTVTFTNDNAVIMNGNISATDSKVVNVIVDAPVTFNGTVTAKALTINTSKSATFNGTATFGSVTQNAGAAITVGTEGALTIGGGSLTSAITNNGTLTFAGNITATGFEVTAGGENYTDVEGNVTDDGNGFKGSTGSSITLVDNSGTIVNSGNYTVTQNDVAYTIQTDGTATTASGGTDYSTYYQKSGEVAVSQILEASAGAIPPCMNIVVSDTGVLNVDDQFGFINAAGGEVVFTEGGAADMLFVTGDAKVSGLTDYSSMMISAGKTATMEEGITSGNVVFSSTEGGVQVTNTGEDEIIYSTDEAAAQVTADTMTVGPGEAETEISNSLVVKEIVNNNAEGLILYGNVADGVTLKAAAGDITMVGQASNTVTVVDLNIASGNTVTLMDTGLEEGIITVTGVLTGGDATLLSDLTLKGGSTLDVNGGDTHALTLGSTLTIDLTEGGLVNLDQTTIDALNGMQGGDKLDLIVALNTEWDPLTYGGDYNGVSYDQLFSAAGLQGNYTVYAQGAAFGLMKSTSPIPEPTTGTLSLLALAALAARRRRK